MSAAALVVAVAVASISAVAGLFWLLFLDYCPPETCSAENAWIAVCVALAVAALVTVIGGMVTIARIARRTIAWPVACGTLILGEARARSDSPVTSPRRGSERPQPT